MGYTDFPASPIIEPGAPANAPDLFGAPDGATAGPCMVEPEPGALLPRDWLRLRVRYVAGSAQNLFEIRIHAASQRNDLLVYTPATTWTIPADLWDAVNQHSVDEPVTITIRGADLEGGQLSGPPSLASAGAIRLAPGDASGTVAYWTTGTGGAGGAGALKGFRIGEETVHDVLTPAQAGVGCIGCHSSTPDGTFVAFSANPAVVDGRPAHADIRSVDGTVARPSFLSPSAATLLGRGYQQQPVFSAAHWQAGDHVAITTYELGGRTELIWTDLEATSEAQGTGWGVFARTGDANQAAAPAISHDGTRLAYTSSVFVSSGVNLDRGNGDLYVIPYGDRQGGAAAPVAGASSPSFSEHYPSFSADDALLAFTRVPAAQSSYDNPESEVFVVPSAGGAAVRLEANQPPACGGRQSPGIANSWPKWSPRVADAGGVRYYWLTFSSRREPNGLPQLYVAAVTVAGSAMTTYPAVYLWNQPAGESNHTPAWDELDIPIGREVPR
ncbi:MAG TPA: hypothetical protein VHE35_04895 [Kofleriaceae bacterium]|nr:hypothetical protein [Kofleriaceae bacterium]